VIHDSAVTIYTTAQSPKRRVSNRFVLWDLVGLLPMWSAFVDCYNFCDVMQMAPRHFRLCCT